MYLIFLLLLHLLPSHQSQSSPANSTDLRALLSFKSHISSDPLNILFSWNETNFCNWLGVTCSKMQQHPERVTALSLNSFNLTGKLSPYLANLTFLRFLNLSGNNFHGHIPSHFGRLSRLQYLDISHNFLQGDIPLSLTHCSELRSIDLSVNSLNGQIPENFSQCQDLNTIRFYKNELSGTISASFGSLLKLAELSVDSNQLFGGIPSSFGNFCSLMYFNLAVNGFTGEIPASLFNISSLYFFNLGSNNLSGELPYDMGSTLPSLQFFYVFYNQFSGSIPVSLSNASRLHKFEIHGNMFTGQVPKDLGSLSNLTLFDIGRNQLETGDLDFLTSLANCSNLSILDLSQNNLQGILPSSVANLSTMLKWVRFAGNKISGSIPPEIGRFSRLTYFDVASNLITGTIPSNIGLLQNLQQLDLSENLLHGKIPSTIGNLTQLSLLFLGENKLQGSIPASIGNMSYLNALDLSHNMLDSAIPVQALSRLYSLSQYLDLSNNMLTGHLSSQIGSLINLNTLDVSENRLSGEIPGSLGSCQLLGVLFMQGNIFEGIIPSALSGLKGIQALDLSRNNLSGSIPEFFEGFHLLNYLNLSFNDLMGRVPQGGVFGNASAISVLGNNKLCGGEEELHLQPCHSLDGSSHKSSLLKVIIPLVIASILVIFVCAAYYIWKKRPKETPPKHYLKELFVQISYNEILKATNGFSSSNLLGVGSFGSVYKGIMDSDLNRVVAIKVLNLEQRGANRSFMAECESLRVIQHRNLVNIITVCSSIDHNGNEFKALIFEYMPNGSLDEWLHQREDEGNANSRSLNLVQRLDIVMDVAFVLDYLHHQCHTPIVHCDLKPSNILLDYDMSARVGDLGLSRFLQRTSLTQDTNSSIGIKGSIGYIAPEYGVGGAVTTKGDVYSYGVLLLETFTGKRPTDDMFQSDLNLHKYVEMAFPDRVLDVIDPSIVSNEGNYVITTDVEEWMHEWMHECMISVLKIGLLCSKESPNERMEMGDVVKELLLVKKLFDGGSHAEATILKVD